MHIFLQYLDISFIVSLVSLRANLFFLSLISMGLVVVNDDDDIYYTIDRPVR